jgi:2-aminophenol/2-amino-5-chlorophenol 1,6-dioxygenase alpha subunit
MSRKALTLMADGAAIKGFLFPGMPHIYLPRESRARAELRKACAAAATSALQTRPDLIVIFSTQWISVLGHMAQARPNPKGLHVDENWYDLGELPYDFRVDLEVTNRMIEHATAAGLQIRPIDFEGFPVDTGTVVALNFFNPDGKIPVVSVSCNIYSGRDEEMKLGKAAHDAIRDLGRRAVVINSSGLSGHYFTTEITDEQDRIVSGDDDAENRRFLDLMKKGDLDAVMDAIPDYARKTGADMQLKGFYWMAGVLGTSRVTTKVHGYGSIWGSGAAVVEFTP